LTGEWIIRRMRSSDLPFAAACTAVEGWPSEDEAALETFFLREPAGCLIAEGGGRPLGMCMATDYGASGFIGELIVRPEVRGRGLGSALLNRAVRHLRSRGVRTIYLDGVPPAVPLYERNGFRELYRSLRFTGRLPVAFAAGTRYMEIEDLPAVFALDRRVFGENRSFFLARRLALNPELARVLVEDGRLTGFIFGRRGEDWLTAGPWVVEAGARRPQALLAGLALDAGDQPVSLGVLECNRAAVELVQSLGLAESPDSPWRMALGTGAALGAGAGCLAIGSPAKG